MFKKYLLLGLALGMMRAVEDAPAADIVDTSATVSLDSVSLAENGDTPDTKVSDTALDAAIVNTDPNVGADATAASTVAVDTGSTVSAEGLDTSASPSRQVEQAAGTLPLGELDTPTAKTSLLARVELEIENLGTALTADLRASFAELKAHL